MNKLNRLEEEIKEAWESVPFSSPDADRYKAVAAVTCKWLRRGMNSAGNFSLNEGHWNTAFPEIWLRENNLYSEPQTKEEI